MPVCLQCQRDRLVNNGSVAGTPKQRCKPCGDQLTRTTPRGKPLVRNVHAGLLSLSGLSRHRLACLLRVSAPSVLNWLGTFAQEHDEQPEPTGQALILELDEMWHDLKHTRRKLWIWKALDPATGQLLDGACGQRDKTTLKTMVKRLTQWEVQRYGTDQWAA
jgi:transposase-like protein